MECPPGYWKIIAIYSMPSGESPVGLKRNQPSYIIDHFSPRKLIANNNYFWGSRSGMNDFYGNPFRSFVQAEFKFLTDRHYSEDIIPYFRQKRKYELSPFLPVLLVPGIDNAWMQELELNRGAEFVISEEDERIRHDYQMTISDLFIEKFLDTHLRWGEQRGIFTRFQPYGMKIDLIRAVGHIHIPETEQEYAGGSDLFLKIISSGANLYNRSIVSAEALTHKNRSLATSPQQMKLAVDKLFSAGVNHLVLNGIPYPYGDESYGEMGWDPLSSPFRPLENYSANISERNPFWKYQAEINQYITRCQYLLRQGKPEIDVLIYYPFLGFPDEFKRTRQHEELYFNGEVPTYPLLYQASELEKTAEGWLEQKPNPQKEWLKQIWHLTQVLDNLGVSWNWVNDESLQEARMENGQIQIRAKTFQMVLLPDVPFIETETARQLAMLSRQGGRILVYGKPPRRQPGFFNYKANDTRVSHYMKELANPNGMQNPDDLKNYFVGRPVEQTIRFDKSFPYIRHAKRTLPNQDQFIFFWNTMSKDRNFSLMVNREEGFYYWLDPWKGTIHKLFPDDRQVLRASLQGYGSGFLYSATEEIIDSILSPLPQVKRHLSTKKEVDVRFLDRWDVVVSGPDVADGEIAYTDTTLFDWRTNTALKYSSSEGYYRCSFVLGKTLVGKQYILDLGAVYTSADIRINTINAATCMWMPGRLDITEFLYPGFNVIEVWVTPGLYNRAVGKSANGNSTAVQFDRDEECLLPAGLHGPVLLYEIEEGI